MDREEQIAELERRIADLRARLPKHSVSSTMLQELERLIGSSEEVEDETGRS